MLPEQVDQRTLSLHLPNQSLSLARRATARRGQFRARHPLLAKQLNQPFGREHLAIIRLLLCQEFGGAWFFLRALFGHDLSMLDNVRENDL